MKRAKKSTMNLSKQLLLGGKAKGTVPCQELPTTSPQRGVREDAQDNLPLGLRFVFLCNEFA